VICIIRNLQRCKNSRLGGRAHAEPKRSLTVFPQWKGREEADTLPLLRIFWIGWGRLRPETRARWGKMNAHQMVCHLNDSFGAAMGDRTTSKDITFPSRTLIKWIALYAPLPWPKGVPTRPEVDQLDRGTRPVEFSHDKAAWAAAIERFAQQPRTFQFPFSPCLRRTHRMGMDALGLPTPQPSPPSIRSVVDIGWGGRTRHETRRLSLTQPDSFR